MKAGWKTSRGANLFGARFIVIRGEEDVFLEVWREKKRIAFHSAGPRNHPGLFQNSRVATLLPTSDLPLSATPRKLVLEFVLLDQKCDVDDKEDAGEYEKSNADNGGQLSLQSN
jgi:hypothetical protein